MKKIFGLLLICLCLAICFGCSKSNDTEEKTTQPSPAYEEAIAADHTTFIADDSYTISGGDMLFSYFEEPLDSFLSVCKYYAENGWTLYRYDVRNGNHFATYTKHNEMVHLYWIECESELNAVVSSTGGSALPSAELASENGSKETTVTQIGSPKQNGMGYVVQLPDGSFIIYDGGYDSLAEELWDTLVRLNGSENNIVIRSWILTHAHDDHYPCFSAFSRKYASRVSLETLMISPLNDQDASAFGYLNHDIHEDAAAFANAKILYVHTGMAFRYGDVTLEILFTGDELWIAEPYRDECLQESMNFNNSSIISRVYTEDYRAIFLGDSSEEVALRLALYYGNYLNSDMCQVAHHGVEDFPLIAYRFINASILWYPCDQALYDLEDRDSDVRSALRNSKYTQEIILHDSGSVTRSFVDK